MPDIALDESRAYISNKRAVVFFPTISAGKIAVLEGTDAIRNYKALVSYFERHIAGENIVWSFDVNQRLSEIDMLADNDLEMEHAVQRILGCYRVLDTDGKDMLYGIPEYPNAAKRRWGKIMFMSQKDLIAAGCFDLHSVV